MHPVVTRIIKINLHNESDIELVRGAVYAWEKRGSAFARVREFSTLLMQKIIDIIGNAREKWGHPAAEKKAEELREIIERSKTEEEILAAIAAMETAETKDDTE